MDCDVEMREESAKKQGWERHGTNEACMVYTGQHEANLLHPTDKSLARIPKSGLITSTSSG